MNNYSAGRLMVFKNDDDIVNEPKIIEFTDFKKPCDVEIAFDDRGERVYVKFTLTDLLAWIGNEHGSDE